MKQVVLEGELFNLGHGVAPRKRMSYRPILEPKDKSVFAGIPIGTEVKMYTLLMNNIPVRQDGNAQYTRGAELRLSDDFFGEEYLIPWVIVDGMAISLEPVMRGIPKEDLIKQGYLEEGE